MNKNIVIECNACGKIFPYGQISLQETMRSDESKELFFNCPACGVCYTVAIVTKTGQDLQRKLDTLRQKIQNSKSPELRKLLVDEFNATIELYQAEVTGQHNLMEG